ncbi:transglycosylase domain-containing protein [Candidatus Gracilibacteria bacterium]|nr:transglycosylase domain-containing protein [Candidatus Gracilibacteria bacterium]
MTNPRIKHITSRSRSLAIRARNNPYAKKISSFLGIGKGHFISRLIGITLLLIALGLFILWGVFLKGAPSIETLATGDYFRESTTIYDKDGGVIYTLFKDGKRTYIGYDDISQSLKDAIISTEDRTFFENPGIDMMGLFRAGAKYIMGSNDTVKGTSTISQQLIRNTILTNERSLKRKLQEMYLSYSLNNNYSKEKILEMYFNAFSFGYNANGVEEASRTYFGKSAKDVGPLGASILASLPKGPTYYSPYLHRDRLMGKLDVYPKEDPTSIKTIVSVEDKKTYAPLYNDFKNYLSGMTMERRESGLNICGVRSAYIKNNIFKPNNQGCLDLNFDEVLTFIGNIAINGEINSGEINGSYIIEYTIGRKDFVANQMLEDGKIDGPTFKKILYDGIEFEFKKYSENIKYPYFVMYIKEYLETKYGKDIDVTNGLKVYTTIDPKLQTFAEEAVKKQALINQSQYGAKSAALVSMDNTTGKLLSMVGGPDYFDIENGGNNNMVTSIRQPGSSFKPIIYGLAIAKNPIGPATPITDSQLSFGKWKPDNYDRSFKGVMTVESALDYSRNIPAVKMYYLAGQEEAIIKFAKGLGLNNLKENFGYGAPIAIGTAEAKPIDMMQAYSVFANNGIKKPVYAIEKITDNENNTIEEHKDQPGEEVMNPAAAYIIAKILSNNEARPESPFWRNALTIPGRSVAAKTGTSNKDVSKGGEKKILPRDLWTIGFSPQITTVVWAGNIDGKETKGSCDGLNCAAPIWKSYMTFALKDLPKEEFKKPKDLYTYNISKISGYLATKDTPQDLVRSTIMAVKLDTYDGGIEGVDIDTLCHGIATAETPDDARFTIFMPKSKPVIDGYDPEWYSGFLTASKQFTSGSGSIEISKEPCPRPDNIGKVDIIVTPVELGKDNVIEIKWNGNRIIEKLKVVSAGKIIKEISYGSSGSTNSIVRINLGKVFDATVELIDTYGYKYTKATLGTPTSGNTGSTTDNKTPPTITMINPKGNSLNLYEGSTFNLRFQTTIATATREINVTIDDKVIQTATTGDLFVFPVSATGLDPGKHTVKVTVTDSNLQTATKTFNLNILPR